MNFALCTDDNYVVPCLTCVISILENNKESDCHVYVLTEGISEKSKQKFEKVASIYNQKIDLVSVSPDSFASFKTYSRYGTSMYYRFLLPEIINDRKVLYLDCDIIVRKDLTELWYTPIEDVACGVVEDQMCDDVILHNRIETNAPYFNSGVLLINLDYWRKNDVVSQLYDFLKNKAQKSCLPDQDALNSVLENKVRYLSHSYNFQEQWYWEQERVYVMHDKLKEIVKWKDDPAIVHYTWNLKPWMEQCFHPHKDWFLHYAKMYDFVGYKTQLRHKPSLFVRIMIVILRMLVYVIKKQDRYFGGKKVTDIISFFHID